ARFGAAEIYDPAAEPDIARSIKQKIGGVDAAIECSGNPGTLNQAIRAVRQCGRVVCVGFYGEGDSRLRLGEEFFHNRISLLASLPALTWNNPTRGEQPLHAKELQGRVIADFEANKITPSGILDPILPFEEAESAADLIATAPEKVVKLMLRHP
ncbi:MAG: zinc-binding dehydrogenase, partial [Rhodomicrobium sp.]|nr:zinc-binding dehydrogenase [Rhodomicrobium sp.]